MALIDYTNKVIYWDEVNWQWLPYIIVSTQGKCSLIKERTRFPLNCQEDAVNALKSFGFSFIPLKHLGVIEVSQALLLYNGVLYQLSKAKCNVLSLVSLITGKSRNWVIKRLEGESVLSEDTVRCLVSDAKQTQIEYQGKFYDSYRSLSEDLGIPYTYIIKNMRTGKTIEDVLNEYSYKFTKVKDHLGNGFDSLNSMLRYYNMTRGCYLKRLVKGWSLEENLTTPVKIRGEVRDYVDFRGKVFSSLTSMACEYGVSRVTMTKLLKEGKTSEEITRELYGKAIKDHLGYSYPTYTKMAEHYGITGRLYQSRRAKGWSLEEALTGKRKER